MKKMNGVNIMLFVFIIILFVVLSCSKNIKNPPSGILLQTDSDFSTMSVQEGMFKAFLFYIAEDGVILRNNSFPEKGKMKLRERFSGKSDTSFILSWEPVFEKISESGDLGYTYGIHTSTNKATGEKSKGTYITVWQKQTDGKWRFVLDTGTQGLPDKTE
jgi:ketosteroid isomerase-like protein